MIMMSLSFDSQWDVYVAGDGIIALESGGGSDSNEKNRLLLQKRLVVAYTLEAGIIFHSIFVGIGLGTSHQTAYVQGLTFALLFHQVSDQRGRSGGIHKSNVRVWNFKFYLLRKTNRCPLSHSTPGISIIMRRNQHSTHFGGVRGSSMKTSHDLCYQNGSYVWDHHLWSRDKLKKYAKSWVEALFHNY